MSTPSNAKDCFVIMPISDPEGYAPGHFQRVYSHAIQPAVEACGYKAARADSVNTTNLIVVDLLQRVISTPLAICDLSARNPNVFFELGIRQAFDMPVVLIKDSKTDRVFDIQGLRTIDYDESLRVDAVSDFQGRLKAAISETISAPNESINSLIRLLGVQRAEVRDSPKVSQDTALLLSAMRDISSRMDAIESARRPDVMHSTSLVRERLDRLLSIFIPADLRARLDEIANERRESVGRVVGTMLSIYVRQYEPTHFDAVRKSGIFGTDALPSEEGDRLVLRLSNRAFDELVTRAETAHVSVSAYAITVLAYSLSIVPPVAPSER